MLEAIQASFFGRCCLVGFFFEPCQGTRLKVDALCRSRCTWNVYACHDALCGHWPFCCFCCPCNSATHTNRGLKNWVGFILGFVFSGLLTFQLYSLVIPQLLDIMGMTTSVRDWNSPLWTLLEVVKGLKLGFIHWNRRVIRRWSDFRYGALEFV